MGISQKDTSAQTNCVRNPPRSRFTDLCETSNLAGSVSASDADFTSMKLFYKTHFLDYYYAEAQCTVRSLKWISPAQTGMPFAGKWKYWKYEFSFDSADQSHKHPARLSVCVFGCVCAHWWGLCVQPRPIISITASRSHANHSDKVPTWVTPTLISAANTSA